MAKSRSLTKDIEPASASTEQKAMSPDSPVYGIKWPANRLTTAQMRTLRQISKDVRLPITQLLKDAVDVYLSLIKREMQAMMVAEPAEPSKTLKQLELFESGITENELTNSDQILGTEGTAFESENILKIPCS